MRPPRARRLLCLLSQRRLRSLQLLAEPCLPVSCLLTHCSHQRGLQLRGEAVAWEWGSAQLAPAAWAQVAPPAPALTLLPPPRASAHCCRRSLSSARSEWYSPASSTAECGWVDTQGAGGNGGVGGRWRRHWPRRRQVAAALAPSACSCSACLPAVVTLASALQRIQARAPKRNAPRHSSGPLAFSLVTVGAAMVAEEQLLCGQAKRSERARSCTDVAVTPLLQSAPTRIGGSAALSALVRSATRLFISSRSRRSNNIHMHGLSSAGSGGLCACRCLAPPTSAPLPHITESPAPLHAPPKPALSIFLPRPLFSEVHPGSPSIILPTGDWPHSQALHAGL